MEEGRGRVDIVGRVRDSTSEKYFHPTKDIREEKKARRDRYGAGEHDTLGRGGRKQNCEDVRVTMDI